MKTWDRRKLAALRDRLFEDICVLDAWLAGEDVDLPATDSTPPRSANRPKDLIRTTGVARVKLPPGMTAEQLIASMPRRSYEFGDPVVNGGWATFTFAYTVKGACASTVLHTIGRRLGFTRSGDTPFIEKVVQLEHVQNTILKKGAES